MNIIQEQDAILKALTFHFDRHSIGYHRLRDYLVENSFDARRIEHVLEGLVKDGYIDQISTFPLPEFKVTPKGEALLHEHGGFEGKSAERQSSSVTNNTTINTGGGDILNSPIVYQSSTDLRDFNANATIAEQDSISNPLPTVKSNGWFRKSIIFCIKHIWQLIFTIGTGIIVYFITKGK